MGVKGLWKLIAPCGKQTIPHDLILAVDTSIWIHQYKGMQESDVIYHISKKIIKLLYHNISPVFVFDGPASILKKKVLEERRVDKLGNLVRDIIDNVICKKCKTKIRICRHGGIKKDEFVSITGGINEKWGDFSNDKDRIICKEKYEISSFSDIKNLMKSDEYTYKQKLKILVKMRERRKDKLEINDSSMINFSLSQIKNIRNRNMVSYYIKKLEDDMSKKIQSDCGKSFILKKDEKKETREFDSSEEINNFLEIEEKDNKKIENIREEPEKKDNNIFEHFNLDNIVRCEFDAEKMSEGFFGNNNIKEDLPDNKKEYNNIKEDLPDNKIEYNNIKEDLPDNKIEYNNIKEDLPDNKKEYNLQSKEIKMSHLGLAQNNDVMDFLSIQSIIKDILKSSNLPFIDSPSESDAQCGYLCRKGIVDGVITEDNDILLHGGVVYKNFFRKNKNIIKYNPKDIESEMGLTVIDLCKVGYVLGSDYTVGIKGIGIKRVLEYIKSKDFLDLDISTYLNIYKNPIVNEGWRPKFGTLDINRLRNYWVKNNIDSERIDELTFYLTNKKK
jgi:5'-3' exonuclease